MQAMTEAAGAMIPEARKGQGGRNLRIHLAYKRTVFPPLSGERLGKSPNPRGADFTDKWIP